MLMNDIVKKNCTATKNAEINCSFILVIKVALNGYEGLTRNKEVSNFCISFCKRIKNPTTAGKKSLKYSREGTQSLLKYQVINNNILPDA